MAEQVTPLNNSPLSQESRQIIVRNTNVSGQSIRGANLLSPITPSETEIKNLEASQKNQESLVQIQTGIFAVQQDINRLNTGLLNIATLLQQDAVNEESILRSQQERERRLSEEQVRVGRESDIERKIDNAIVAPVQRVAPKVQNLFGNVLQSLSWLFGGWLTNQVIEYIKEEGNGNNNRLNEIKYNILKNLGIAGGVLLAVKIGIGTLKRTVFGITKQLGSLIGKTITAPFNAVKNLLPLGTKPGGSPSPKTSGTPAPKPSGGILSGLKNFGSSVKNTSGNFIKGMGLPLLTGSVMTGLDISSGEDPGRAVSGTVGGMVSSSAAFALGSLLPIPGSGLISGALAYGPGEDIGKNIYDKFFNSTPSNNNQKINEKIESAKPVENLQSSNMNETSTQKSVENLQSSNMNETSTQKSVEGNNNLTPIENQLFFEIKSLLPSESSTTQVSQENKLLPNMVDPKINTSNYSNFLNISFDQSIPNVLEDKKSESFEFLDIKNVFGNQKDLDSYSKVFDSTGSSDKFILPKDNSINSPPKPDLKLGELPEPKPNIIYASTGSKSNNSPNSSSGPIGGSGVLADVPLIQPNNPDNFQILLAHSIYNVVI